MEISFSDFELIILPGKNPSKAFEKYYNSAYDTWHSTWTDASKEIKDFPSTLYANDFLAQDEIHCVFYRGECTSLGFWTRLNMEFKASKEHFYFRNWDEYALKELTKDGGLIAKYSFFTVDKKYRKWARNRGFKFPDVQVGLFGMRLKNSQCTAMTGTTRNERKINEVCIEGGAQLISKNLSQHGGKVDLLAWYRENLKFNPEVFSFVEYLWNRRKIDERILNDFNSELIHNESPQVNL